MPAFVWGMMIISPSLLQRCTISCRKKILVACNLGWPQLGYTYQYHFIDMGNHHNLKETNLSLGKTRAVALRTPPSGWNR